MDSLKLTADDPKWLKGRRVTVPLFEIGSNPTIPFSEIRERRFNLIERAQGTARSQIMPETSLRGTVALSAVDNRLDESSSSGSKPYKRYKAPK